MRLKTSTFCGLSRSPDWQQWLSLTAPDLAVSLTQTLKGGSCGSNSAKMLEIYNKLYQRGLGATFEEFIRSRFSYIIEDDRQLPAPSQKQQPIVALNYGRTKTLHQDPHKIFANYRPDMMTFPQRIIFQGPDSDSLRATVAKFTMDKLGVDFEIIGDLAYVEYFDSRYADVVEKFSNQTRELAKYRLRQRV